MLVYIEYKLFPTHPKLCTAVYEQDIQYTINMYTVVTTLEYVQVEKIGSIYYYKWCLVYDNTSSAFRALRKVGIDYEILE